MEIFLHFVYSVLEGIRSVEEPEPDLAKFKLISWLSERVIENGE